MLAYFKDLLSLPRLESFNFGDLKQYLRHFLPSAMSQVNHAALGQLVLAYPPTLNGLRAQLGRNELPEFIRLVAGARNTETAPPLSASQELSLGLCSWILKKDVYFRSIRESTPSATLSSEQWQKLGTWLANLKFRAIEHLNKSGLTNISDEQARSFLLPHMLLLLEDDSIKNLITLKLTGSPEPDWQCYAKIPPACIDIKEGPAQIDLAHVTTRYVEPLLDANTAQVPEDIHAVFRDMQASQLFLMAHDRWGGSPMRWAIGHSVNALNLILKPSAKLHAELPRVVHLNSMLGFGTIEDPLTCAARLGESHLMMKALFDAGYTLRRSCPDAVALFENMITAEHRESTWYAVSDKAGKVKAFIQQAMAEELWPDIKSQVENILQDSGHFRAQNMGRDVRQRLELITFLTKDARMTLPHAAHMDLFIDALRAGHLSACSTMLMPEPRHFIHRAMHSYARALPAPPAVVESNPESSASPEGLQQSIPFLATALSMPQRHSDESLNKFLLRREVIANTWKTVFAHADPAEIRVLMVHKGEALLKGVEALGNAEVQKLWLDSLDNSEPCRALKQQALKHAIENGDHTFERMLKNAGVSISWNVRATATIKNALHRL